ncbi:MAG: zinc transporter ZupT [candidate division WOR-3 bacterium]
MHGNFWFALGLSAAAATATTLGSLLGMLVHRPGTRFMAFSLGFSAGVMMFVSFAELLWSSIHEIGFAYATVGFFGGLLLMFVIDIVVPHTFIGEHGGTNPAAECGDWAEGRRMGWRHRHQHGAGLEPARLLRAGLMIALGIGIHNLPEGMATFTGAIKSRGLGIAIAAAIALHNIPEGLAVAVPVFCATGSRGKALGWSAISGGAELLGALLAAAVLMPLLTPVFLAWVLAAVAGLMVFVSLDELIPGSYAYDREHFSVAGVISGMALMAISIWLLGK